MIAERADRYATTSVAELTREDGWAPIRRSMGIRSFGTNAWTSREIGAVIIPEHVEISHEELYLVIRGHATFTLDGAEIDAPVGALVLVTDPTVTRAAIAVEADTVVLSIGAEPGVAYEPNFWETNRDVLPLFERGRYEEARAILLAALDEYADHSGLLFNLACAETRLGRLPEALGYLREAVVLRGELGALASGDTDLAELHGDPRFLAIVALAGG